MDGPLRRRGLSTRMPRHQSYQGKRAVITGGASGLGLAMAKELESRGATPIIIDINQSPIDLPAYIADVRSPEALATTLAQIETDHGPIDLAIANAAIDITGEAHQFAAEDWRTITDTNLLGTTNLVAALYPKMVARKSGQILFISSGAALIHFPLGVPYTATKTALLSLASALRAEARPHGVRINLVCPPIMDTPILSHGNAKPGINRAAFLASLQKTPMPVAKAARIILHASARDRSPIIFPASLRWANRLVAIFPALRPFIQARIIRTFEKTGRNTGI